MSICEGDVLSENQLKSLVEGSGISQKILDEAEVSANNFKKTGIAGEGIAFPYFNEKKEFIGARVRLSELKLDQQGKQIRYLEKKGGQSKLFFLKKHVPTIFSCNEPLFVVEGEKKALSLASQEEFAEKPVVAFPGVWNWTRKDSGGELSESWQTIPMKDREINLIPDSDFFTNSDVKNAICRFIRNVQARGGRVNLISLNFFDKAEGKHGLDDEIVSHGTSRILKRIQNPFWEFYPLTLETFKESREKLFRSMVLLDEAEKAILIDDFAEENKSFRKGTARICVKKERKEWLKHMPKPKPKTGELIWFKSKESVDDLNHKLADAVAKLPNVFRVAKSRSLIYVFENSYEIISTAESLSGFLSNFISFRTATEKDGELVVGPINHFPKTVLESFILNEKYFKDLPSVDFVTNLPQVYGNKIIADYGYDEEHKVFYMGPDIEESNSSSGKLRKLISSFPLDSEIDKSNVLGLLISFFYINQFKGKHPAIIIQGDKQNLGKTTLADVFGVILDGKVSQKTQWQNEDELQKRIVATLRENNTFLIDNIKSSRLLSSPLLEQLITSEEMSIRLLGKNENFHRPNNALFIFTLNGGAFSDDLATRSVYLALSQKAKESQGFDPTFCPVSFALKHRKEIIQDLLFLIKKSFDQKSETRRDFGFFKFLPWAINIHTILNSIEIDGFLINQAELKDKNDSVRAAIFDFIFNQFNGDRTLTSSYTCSEIVNSLPDNVFDWDTPQRAKATKVGLVLNKNESFNYGDETFFIEVRASGDGGKSKKYRFRKN